MLTTLVAQAHAIDLYCNTDKAVAMVFPPKNRRLVIGNDFPLFRLGHKVIKYVSFKYLGHVITQNCSDDENIQREIRNLFIRTIMLIRKFHRCLFQLNITLFRTYCLSMYDIALWTRYSQHCVNRFCSA